jgi:hypothetical protein
MLFICWSTGKIKIHAPKTWPSATKMYTVTNANNDTNKIQLCADFNFILFKIYKPNNKNVAHFR